MRLSAGSPARLGASWDGRGTNFALFSANAEKVELCLFDGQGRRELERIELPERDEDVWHGYLNDVSPGQLYGYRVHGRYEPEHGHRFNPKDRKSTRLNSSHLVLSYAVFCLNKKNQGAARVAAREAGRMPGLPPRFFPPARPLPRPSRPVFPPSPRSRPSFTTFLPSRRARIP